MVWSGREHTHSSNAFFASVNSRRHAEFQTRLFDTSTIQYEAALPQGATKKSGPKGDCMACQLSQIENVDYLYCLFSSKAVEVWDITNPSSPSFVSGFEAHASCIWDIEVDILSAVCVLPSQ